MKKSTADYLFVGIQLCLFVLYLWMPPRLDRSLDGLFSILGGIPMVIGAVLFVAAIIQLAGVLSAFPSPKPGGKLVTEGVFKYMRHPIYTGILLVAFGYAIYAQDFNKLLASLVMLVFFEMKAGYEERKLRAVYPGYEAYSLRTGKFLPYFFKAEFRFDPAGDVSDSPAVEGSEGENSAE